MKTSIAFKLQQPFANVSFNAAAMVKVRRIADVDGAVLKQWWQLEKPVSIVGEKPSSARFITFNVPGGGYYNVNIKLPKGVDISRDYLLKEGDVRKEMITIDIDQKVYLGGCYSSEGGEATPCSAFCMDKFDVSSDYHGNEPDVFQAVSMEGKTSWEVVGGVIPKIFPQIFRGRSLSWPVAMHESYVAWNPQMPSEDQARDLIDELRRFGSLADDADFPRWVLVSDFGGRTLASIPWAWWGSNSESRGAIRIVFDYACSRYASNEDCGQLRVNVQDKQWFGLLEFLSSGRLSQAESMIDKVLRREKPEEALYGKVKSPLLAVVGAIILIARSRNLRLQDWDQWLVNLAEWFPGIPDGPILLGCRLVARAEDIEGLHRAFQRIKDGVSRGIPYFSASIAMMNDALARLGAQIPEAEELRRFVGSVSARVDPGQPFTVIRI